MNVCLVCMESCASEIAVIFPAILETDVFVRKIVGEYIGPFRGHEGTSHVLIKDRDFPTHY